MEQQSSMITCETPANARKTDPSRWIGGDEPGSVIAPQGYCTVTCLLLTTRCRLLHPCPAMGESRVEDGEPWIPEQGGFPMIQLFCPFHLNDRDSRRSHACAEEIGEVTNDIL